MHNFREEDLPFLESEAVLEAVNGGIQPSVETAIKRFNYTVHEARFRLIKLPFSVTENVRRVNPST